MDKREEPKERRERPEIFWILFLLVSAAVFFAMVEPARREAAAARRRLAELEGELEKRRAKVKALRRERKALESGDLEALRAAAHAAGLNRPGAWDEPEESDGRRQSRAEQR